MLWSLDDGALWLVPSGFDSDIVKETGNLTFSRRYRLLSPVEFPKSSELKFLSPPASEQGKKEA
jgi:hypothetical protein